MESSNNNVVVNKEHEGDDQMNIETLPTARGVLFPKLHLYEGFWYTEWMLKEIISAQQHFTARPDDIFLCSPLKSGTTWLKALAFAVVTRTHYDYGVHNNNNISNIIIPESSPLLTSLPHDCIPVLERDFSHHLTRNDPPKHPLVATHIPYLSLPKSIIASNACKIVYIHRDPKDAFISLWHFLSKLVLPGSETITRIEEAFEIFCKGEAEQGPYWDHVLGYLKASLESPDKVLVLKYEDMMLDTAYYVKNIAEFMGCPFTLEEEKEGVVKKIVDFCSFDKLSNLDVNKKGKKQVGNGSLVIKNNTYFRKGKVGDWKNYLSAEMGKQLDQIIQHKFSDCGLKF